MRWGWPQVHRTDEPGGWLVKPTSEWRDGHAWVRQIDNRGIDRFVCDDLIDRETNGLLQNRLVAAVFALYDETREMSPETPDPFGKRWWLPHRGIRMEGTCFWVIHRRREFGPFDYEWSHDLRGMALLYRGTKFGEICSADEIFADLKEFHLPDSVSKVATLILGCILYGIMCGLNSRQRYELIRSRLVEQGFADFLDESQP